MDEACWYVGTTIEAEMDEAGNGKPSKGERKAQSARQRVIDKYFGSTLPDNKRFADPMMFFVDTPPETP